MTLFSPCPHGLQDVRVFQMATGNFPSTRWWRSGPTLHPRGLGCHSDLQGIPLPTCSHKD
jgi:hypothetical protein